MAKRAEYEKAARLIRSLWGSGPQIAAECGLHRSGVARLAKSLGVKLPRVGNRRGTSLVHLKCEHCNRPFTKRRSTHASDSKRYPGKRTFCSKKCFRDYQGWSKSDIDTLRSMHRTATNEEIAKALGRTKAQVAVKLCELNLLRVKHWRGDELAHLKKFYSERTHAELAKDLGRTKAAVSVALRLFGIAPRRQSERVEACKRCGCGRNGHAGNCFRRGYCSRCYQYMAHFRFNEAIAAAVQSRRDDFKALRTSHLQLVKEVRRVVSR